MAGDETHLVVELREKFKKKFIDPQPPRFAKFDQRDIARVYNDDLYALSFVHWKKEVVDDAVAMVADVLEWRTENKVADLSVDNIGMDVFKKGHLSIPGRDINGMRFMVLAARLYTKDQKENVRKLMMFWLERLQRKEPGKHIIFILDTSKTAVSNVELSLIRFIIDSFTLYFPDMLERIIILDMPWIMNAIWNIVKQWMTEEQRSRTVFCTRKDLKKYISVDQLPENMNGQSSWTYSFPPFPDDVDSQDHDFLNDPMNFENGDREETSSLPSEDEAGLANGDIIMNAEDNFNNNRFDEDKIQKEERLHFENDATPSTSGLSIMTGQLSEKSVELRKTERQVIRGPDDSLGIRKTASFDDVDDRIVPGSHEKEAPGKLRRHNTANAALSLERAGPNVSFRSVKGDEREGVGDAAHRIRYRSKVSTSEIKLGNLLVMSPVSELVFSVLDGKVQGFMEVRNPNPDTDDDVRVAYKVKTTSPERYHVKPSVGVIAPGDSVQIRILLTPGYEGTAAKDRFLLIYKTIEIVNNESPSHSQIVRYWKQNTDKATHAEHKLRVRFDDSVVAVQGKNRRNVNTSTPNHYSGEPQPSSSVPRSSSATSFLTQERSSGDADIVHLQQQLTLLNNKVTRLETDTRWMKRRMRHSMVLLLILILLLLFILYEVSSISHLQSTALACRSKVMNETCE